MKKIGFKNFRKFENFPTIALGDVTYLVGQNNAGKSTTLEATIMMLENLTQMGTLPINNGAYFGFDSKVHDGIVGSYSNVLCRNSDEKRIQFNASIGDFDFEIVVVPADDEVFYLLRQTEMTRIAPIDYLLVRDNVLGVTVEIYPFLMKYVLTFAGASDTIVNQYEAQIAEVNTHISFLRDSKESTDDITVQVKINTELETLEKKRAMLLKNKKASNEEQLVFNSLRMTYSPEAKAMNSIVREIDALAYMAQNDDALKQSRLSSLTLGMSESEKKQQGQYLTKLRKHSEELSKMASRLNALLLSVKMEYVPARTPSQKQVFYAHGKDFYDELVNKYVQKTQRYDRDKSIYRFMQTWMDKEHFNIGKGFVIDEKMPGYYNLMVDTYDNGPIYLGNMGMGTNHLMYLLLCVANNMLYARMHQRRPMMFIEEPEQNLHPNLQSKLADFFYELATSKECPIQFVVETHSEYIIRKSQYIVAKQKYKDDQDLSHNPQKVYFFPLDRPVYDMHYNPNGTFEESFAPGFYDMASDLTMDTLMLSM